MKTPTKPQDGGGYPSPHASSPNASSTCSAGGTSGNINGGIPTTPPPTPPPLTPRSIPTTFVHANPTSFKQVVQMLTGSAATAAAACRTPPRSPIPPAMRPAGPKKPAFKLYERRSGMRHLEMIRPGPGLPAATALDRRKQIELLSPSTLLDLPSLRLSPETPPVVDPFNRYSSQPTSSPPTSTTMSEEERAIADKGFYFHPSPRDAEPPRLLPLFPVTSPSH